MKTARFPFAAAVVIGLILGSFLATHGLAQNAPAIFDQANKLYEQGKFAEAVQSYESLRQQGQTSAEMLFNLGNAYFKSGQTGRAILAYRQAELLAPRDPDLRANLSFVGGTVNSAHQTSRWSAFLRRLTLNEWTFLTMQLLWVWFALLIAGQIKAAWQKPLRLYTRLAGAATIACVAILLSARQDVFGTQSGVIISKEAVVRYGPVEESQSNFVLHDGAEVRVVDQNNGWLRVTDFAKREGWLKADQVALLHPAKTSGS